MKTNLFTLLYEKWINLLIITTSQMASEFITVALHVLRSERRPLTAKEILSIGIRDKLFSDKIAGETPHQTLKSKLSVDIRRKGEGSPFIRTAPGRFFLRNLLEADQKPYFAKPMVKNTSTEDVLVFDSSWLNSKRRFQGIKKNWKRFYSELLNPKNCTYFNRSHAETILSHKQLLTYIIVKKNGSVLAYKRGNYNRVEDFLRGSECIGFGGHVSRQDLDLFTNHDMGIINNVCRELSEELKLPELDKSRMRRGEGLSCIGVLNDDSSKAGQRHLAFIFEYNVSDDPYWERPERGEKSITQLRWLDPGKLQTPFWRFEYWSQLCLREFLPKLVKAYPAYNIRRKRPLSSPHILCVLGAVGSGKSELTRLLCDEFGYQEINTGKVLAKLLGIPPVPETARDEFQKRAWDFIETNEGPVDLASAIWTEAISLGCELVLVDGLRQLATLNSLRKLAGPIRMGIVYVYTLPDIAYQFYKEREGNNSSIFQFLEVRNAQVENEVDGLITEADAVLYNWLGLDSYKRTIRKLIQELDWAKSKNK